MNLAMCMAFAALATVAYGATVVPASPQKVALLSEDDQANVVGKVGKSLEALGKALQGKVSTDNSEDRLQVAQALQALTDAEGALDKDSSEYWVGVVVKGIIGGVVGHAIDKWKNRG